MKTNAKRCELTEYAIETINHKARQLVGKAGYTRNDVEDIKQDLIADLLERLPKFDPAKATYNTFVARVIERKISNLLRDRRAEVRDHRREVCSLNEEIDTGEDEFKQRVTTISQDDQELRLGRYRQRAEERNDLKLDIQQVLAGLPVDLRRAAELLQAHSVAQAAREMGVPHATFYDNYVKRLREIFAAEGLTEHLE